MISIQVKNKSTVVADTEVKRVIDACNKQLSRDFGPVYGIKAECHFSAKDTPLSAYDWQLIVIDNADVAGALGYHDVSVAGTPIGYCFAETTRKNGGNWTVTYSHELLEMVADPEINRCVIDESGQKLYAEEVCDACEDDSLAYAIDGVMASDFVLPPYWLSTIKPHAPLSFAGHITKPLEILPGGYLAWLDLKNTGKGWQQKFGAEPKATHGSRLARRGTPVSQRRASIAS